MNAVKLHLECLGQEDGGCRLGVCTVQIRIFQRRVKKHSGVIAFCLVVFYKGGLA